MKFLMRATEPDLVLQSTQSTTDCTDDSDNLKCRSTNVATTAVKNDEGMRHPNGECQRTNPAV
jgi:hypothetical protein